MKQYFKCVCVGDGAVGKTSLFMEFSSPGSSKDAEYIPSVFDVYNHNQTVFGVNVTIGLWEPGGRSDYDRLRPLSYPETDFFLVCFSLVNRHSFENIREKWIPELDHHCPNVPKFLVGTKADLKEDETTISKLQEKGMELINEVEIRNMVNELNFIDYTEISSFLHLNVDEVFLKGVEFLKSPQKKKEKENCLIL